MPLTASTVSTLPLSVTVRTKSGYKDQVLQTGCCPVRVSPRVQSSDLPNGLNKLAGLKKLSHPIYGRKHSSTKPSASITCAAAALNARCSTSGQTQTLTREAPTKAPVREPTKTPKLDDGGTGFPPRGDGGGGGGGGGGGENWSGGFFLFGVLIFLSFLKDIESDHRDSRRR